MLYEFHQRKNGPLKTSVTNSVYSEEAIILKVCRNWFKRFRDGDFGLQDKIMDKAKKNKNPGFDHSSYSTTCK